ncbi:winged helix-turn-helix transcriptional regulator [Falsiroseomonas tokyonensis]|uniref:Winged-helix domain-containing protein n=1 Tax=Falsiroseomonas tokyonensis TaxID=430521 RepID=A0ABV7BZ57_9PROT|nr:response regulator transcription factor [Falsiroseomonas tokyonensis]MBU8540679.1 response regulator transcription factor [Falsiroseomonas tokyonensis]
MQLLIIADRAAAQNEVWAGLEAAGIAARLLPAPGGEEAASLRAGQQAAREAGEADGVLIDCAAFRGQALPLLQGLREAGCALPILLLASAGPEAEVEAFNLGADALLPRQVPVPALVTRLAAIQRRSRLRPSGLLRCGNVVLDRATGRLAVDGQPVEATPLERALLELLISARGAVLPRERITKTLQDGPAAANSAVLRVIVCRLRRKLAECGADDIIHTVWGVGYRAEAPASRTPPAWQAPRLGH